MNTSLKILLGATTLTVALATSAQAQTLMLNFRSSGGPTGANLTNSPLHTSEPSFTDTTWNNVSNSDVGSGLLYADGSAATGVLCGATGGEVLDSRRMAWLTTAFLYWSR